MIWSRQIRDANGGFTLIELIIVIGIIFLLTAILMPTALATRDSYNRVATTDLIGGLVVALKILKLEAKHFPLPDNQKSTVSGNPGYYCGVFRYDRSGTNPGLVNRLVDSQKFKFDAAAMLNDNNVLIDGWGNPTHYILGDAKNSKNLKLYNPNKPQDTNKPKHSNVLPADSDWNTGDMAGYPYIYSEGHEPDCGEKSWIYARD